MCFHVQPYDKRTTAGITVMIKVSKIILLRSEDLCQPNKQVSKMRYNVAGREAEPKFVMER